MKRIDYYEERVTLALKFPNEHILISGIILDQDEQRITFSPFRILYHPFVGGEPTLLSGDVLYLKYEDVIFWEERGTVWEIPRPILASRYDIFPIFSLN